MARLRTGGARGSTLAAGALAVVLVTAGVGGTALAGTSGTTGTTGTTGTVSSHSGLSLEGVSMSPGLVTWRASGPDRTGTEPVLQAVLGEDRRPGAPTVVAPRSVGSGVGAWGPFLGYQKASGEVVVRSPQHGVVPVTVTTPDDDSRWDTRMSGRWFASETRTRLDPVVVDVVDGARVAFRLQPHPREWHLYGDAWAQVRWVSYTQEPARQGVVARDLSRGGEWSVDLTGIRDLAVFDGGVLVALEDSLVMARPDGSVQRLLDLAPGQVALHASDSRAVVQHLCSDGSCPQAVTVLDRDLVPETVELVVDGSVLEVDDDLLLLWDGSSPLVQPLSPRTTPPRLVNRPEVPTRVSTRSWSGFRASFWFSKPLDTCSVSVTTVGGRPVATLPCQAPHGYAQVTWDLQADGATVPTGTYRWRVVGADADGDLRGSDGAVRDLGGTFELTDALPAPVFADVGADSPFVDDVGWLEGTGISRGYPDGTFRPEAPVSRQAMASFLHRSAGAPVVELPAAPSFTDVPTTSPFYEEVEWMVGEGLAGGYVDGTFRPTVAVTRQAVSAFLHRGSGDDTPPPDRPAFSDVGVGSPFHPAVSWMASRGIASGWADGTFRPTAPVSRQAAAAFLHRADSS